MNRPLSGKRILVTRPADQSSGLASRIAACGGQAECFPLIDIAPPQDWRAMDEAIARLETFAIVIFISPNAASFGLGRLLSRRSWPERVAAAALGPGTAGVLAEAGVAGVIAPRGRYDSEALLSLDLLGAGRIAGQGVLIVRGDGGRDLLAETLRARGARVECVPCYRRSPPRDGAPLVSMLRGRALDAVTLSSTEGLRNLLQLLDTGSRERLLDLPVFVSHRRIANEAARRGLRRVVLTGPEDGGLVTGMCTYRWADHER